MPLLLRGRDLRRFSHPREPPRWQPDVALEATREVALVVEARGEGNATDRHAMAQEHLRVLDAEVAQVATRRHPRLRAEQPREVEGAQARDRRELAERGALGVVLVQVREGAPDPRVRNGRG